MKFITADWPAPEQIKAYTTTRQGWGEHYKSQPQAGATEWPRYLPRPEERDKLATLLQMPSEPIWLDQVHGADVVEAAPSHLGKSADASYTQEKNRICAILTADCLPLFICDKSATRVAAIHAGWRSLCAGMIENTINALNIPASELLIWLGPAIGPEKFEVGKDVYDAFTAKHQESAKAFIQYKEDKWLASLYTLARIRLGMIDVTSVYGGNYCTYSEENLFYSYRRDKGKTGRMASLIWIEDK